MGESDYSFSLTTFSPSGKLVQIEYALNAVAAGSTSLGIKGCEFARNVPSFQVVTFCLQPPMVSLWPLKRKSIRHWSTSQLCTKLLKSTSI